MPCTAQRRRRAFGKGRTAPFCLGGQGRAALAPAELARAHKIEDRADVGHPLRSDLGRGGAGANGGAADGRRRAEDEDDGEALEGWPGEQLRARRSRTVASTPGAGRRRGVRYSHLFRLK